MLYNNFSSDFEFILNKCGQSTMQLKILRTLALEVFKTLHNMNPEYMKEIFHKAAFLLILRLTKTIQLNMEVKV